MPDIIKGYNINISNVTGDIKINGVAIKQVQPEVIYNITNNLTNCTTNNTLSSISQGTVYSSVITADNGYDLNNVTVTMGGIDITSDVVTDDTDEL